MTEREEFLLKMYDQMFNDIDRHHKLVWQVLGVVVSAFALYSLMEKNIMSVDVVTSIVIFLMMWIIAHVIDANYWYNRNLAIITNIEQQFLKESDVKDIHYYFSAHRKANSMQTSLKIQLFFCGGLIIIFLMYHFIKSLVPGFSSAFTPKNISLVKTLPYVVFIISGILLFKLQKKRVTDYKEFLKNSPGKIINTQGITYGSGHPVQPAQSDSGTTEKNNPGKG